MIDYYMEVKGQLDFADTLSKDELVEFKRNLRKSLLHPKWFEITNDSIVIHQFITANDRIEEDVNLIVSNNDLSGVITVVGENPGDVWRVVVPQGRQMFIERATLSWPDGTEYSE